MKRFFFTAVSLLFAAASYSQNIHGTISRIFLDADLNRRDTSILTMFRADTSLALVEKEVDVWKIAKVKDAAKEKVGNYIFAFTRHPYFVSDLYKGSYLINTFKSGDTASVTGASINIIFNSEMVADITFDALAGEIQKLSVTERKDKPLDDPKFRSRTFLVSPSQTAIILTKGKYPDKTYSGRSFIVITIKY